MVTSRCSYEMVQKAAALGAVAIAAVSAPTSLAIETAEQAGIALVAFVRESRLTVYANRTENVERGVTQQAVFGITGWKNAGKTTLAERLVAEFVRRGWRVATIKHAHHAADIDKPGTESFAIAPRAPRGGVGRRSALRHHARTGGADPGRGAGPAGAGRPGADRGLQARPTS